MSTPEFTEDAVVKGMTRAEKIAADELGGRERMAGLAEQHSGVQSGFQDPYTHIRS